MNVVVHAYPDERAGPARGRGRRRGRGPDRRRSATSAMGIRPRPDVDRPSLRIGLTLIAALSSSFEISGGVDRGTEIRMHLPLQRAASADGEAASRRRARRRAGGDRGPGRPAGAGRPGAGARPRRPRRPPARSPSTALSDAMLLSDAISAARPRGLRRRPRLAQHRRPRRGRRAAGRADDRAAPPSGVREGLDLPEVGGSLETLADELGSSRTSDGEYLVVAISLASRRASRSRVPRPRSVRRPLRGSAPGCGAGCARRASASGRSARRSATGSCPRRSAVAGPAARARRGGAGRPPAPACPRSARSPRPRRRPTPRPAIRPPRRRPGGRARAGRRLWLASSTSSTSVGSTSSRAAISPTEGERCSSTVSSVIALSTSAMRSCRPRGTRTVQTRSRKWRFSSPRMVGEAKAVKGVPRLGVEAVDRVDAGRGWRPAAGRRRTRWRRGSAAPGFLREGQVAAHQLLAGGRVAVRARSASQSSRSLASPSATWPSGGCSVGRVSSLFAAIGSRAGLLVPAPPRGPRIRGRAAVRPAR